MNTFTSMADLLNYHGRISSAYCAVIKETAGYTIGFQLTAGKPQFGDYRYKIFGDIKFENIDWDDGDDGIRYYQIWEIEQTSENRLYIIFDVGSVEVVFGEIEITPLTKEEYVSVTSNSRK